MNRVSRRGRTHDALWWLAVAGFFTLGTVWVRELDWAAVAPSWLFLLTALGRSWLLALISIGIGALAAAPLAFMRLYGQPGLRHVTVALIESVRATPELMLIFWVYFTLPLISGSQVTAWNAALGALSVIAAAYLAEVIRAGLNSVPAGQFEAARSLGLSGAQAFTLVVLPQALRNMLPALVAQFVALFKTTSLVSAIGVMDFFRAVSVTGNAVFAPYPLYLILAAGYFVSCSLISRIVYWLDPRYQLLE